MAHNPRKRFGQHFLSDSSTISRIISAIAPTSQDTIIEIGCGKGALTGALLNQVSQLHAIEIDRDLSAILKQQFQRADKPLNKLQIHCADALKINFAKIAQHLRVRIVGNLPYNISTPLLFHLATFHDCIIDMHLMLQHEVVQRLTATVGSKQYGRLSVIVGCCFEMEKLFDVLPESFTPPPKVISSFAYFKPHPRLADRQLKELDEIVRLAFAHRRKTIANALSALFDVQTLEYLGIDPRLHVDNIKPSQFLYMLKYREQQRR